MHELGTFGGEDEPIAEMNVIPFIDICLVLLIIVLVTAAFTTKLLGFDHQLLADGEEQRLVPVDQAMTLDVAADGSCMLNGAATSLDALPGQLAAGGSTPTVLLRADADVPAKQVVAAVNAVRRTGQVELAFVLGK